MKSVPFLSVLSIVALALVVALFAQSRGLEERLAALEAEAPAAEAPGPSGGAEVARLPVSRGVGADRLAGLEPAEMEVFRQRVRRAQELNVEEDTLRRFVERIDVLVEEGRVVGLSVEHKLDAARTLMGTRNAIPEILRERRATGELARMSSDERRELIRTEYQRIRAEAEAEIAGFLPAEDARTIVADAFHDTQGPSDP
jgi:hypothetical protein